MRWIWLDHIVELQSGQRCVAIKNVSLSEDVVHDHFPAVPGAHPAIPCMPHSLIIEGMAQTAGILVGYTGGLKEKVILAKIGKAVFTEVLAQPGMTIRHTATLDRFDTTGASCSGTVELIDSATGTAQPFAQIDLMFSHVDQNRQGLAFPKDNFVFTELFLALLVRSGIAIPEGVSRVGAVGSFRPL